jgi:hypothetical protein
MFPFFLIFLVGNPPICHSPEAMKNPIVTLLGLLEVLEELLVMDSPKDGSMVSEIA